MTKLEELNGRLDELTTLLDANNVAKKKVYEQERKDLTKVLEKFFTAEEGDAVDCTHSSVNVRVKGADSYSHFLTIYVDDSWNDDDSKTYTKLYVSNYSFRTEDMGEWIVERFEKQAHYSRIAVDFQDDILAEMNQIAQAASDKMNEIYEPGKVLRKEASEIRKEIEAIEKEARLKALMSEEGLEIEGTEVERWGDKVTVFPDLQVKFDWTVRSIRGLRIDKTSTSGKSADITVKVKRTRWTSEEESKEVIEDLKIERVRMDNIESFLRQNDIVVS